MYTRRLIVVLLILSMALLPSLPLSLAEDVSVTNPSSPSEGTATTIPPVDPSASYTPPAQIELTDMRTPFSRTLLREDGLYQTEVTLQPVFQKDRDGHLQPAAESFASELKDDAFSYSRGQDQIAVGLDSTAALVTAAKGNRSVSLRLEGARPVPVSLRGSDQYGFDGILPATDLRYSISAHQIKEELVLTSTEAPTLFVYRLTLQNLTLSQEEGVIHLRDAETGEDQFLLLPMWAQDAKGARLESLPTSVWQEGNQVTLRVSLEESWLTDPDRVFPIVLDPTIIIQPDSQEASIAEVGTFTPLKVGYTWKQRVRSTGQYWDPELGWVHTFEYWWQAVPLDSLLKFSLPQLPSGVTIQQAQLLLSITSDDSSNVGAHKITSSWSSGVTWATKPTYESGYMQGSRQSSQMSFDVTTTVSAWYAGGTNYGFYLNRLDALPPDTDPVDESPDPPPDDSYVAFANSSAGDTAPRLTIVYSANDASGQNLGRESQWTYADFSLPLAGAGVNVSNGNLVLSQTDLSLPSRGIPAVLSRTYNSRSNQSGLFGYGWSSSLELKLTPSGDGSRVDFFDADGTCLPFYKYKTLSGLDYYKSPPGFAGTLQRNTSTATYSIGFQDNSVYNFDSGGKITTFRDRNGNVLTWEYSGGQLVRLKDSVNRQINLTYTSGKITSVTDYSNRSFSFSYNGGFLQTVTYSPSVSCQFTYTASQLVTYRDPNLKNWSFGYSSSKVSSFTDPLTHGVTVSYPSSSRTQVQTSLGSSWSYDYSVAGLVSRITDPFGYQTDLSYNNDSTLTSVTNAKGQKTSYAWDNRYNVLTVTDTLGYTVTTTYNALGLPTGVTDQRGLTTSFSYDGKGNLLTTQNPLGNTTTCTYDAYGQLTRVTAPLTPTQTVSTAFTYDSYGNCTQVADPGGHTTTTSYTVRGALFYQLSPLAAKTSCGYDVLDRLLTVTDTLGNTTTSTYDACGRLLYQSDGLGTLMTYTYDDAGRLIRTNTPTVSYYDGSNVSQVTQYGYDSDNRLTQVTDPAGKISSYGYDALNRTLTATDPAGRTTTCTYDALNLTSTTDPKGQTFNYTYDGLNRLTQLSAPGQTIGYSYLANGLVYTITDAGGTTTYSYDNANRLTQAQTPQGTIGYGYNLAGLTTSATYPQGTVRYEYDNQGRLSTIKRPDASYAGLAFDSGDRITQLSQYRSDNGLFLRTTYSYDALNRTTKIQNTTGPTLSLAYSYDARANVSAKTATTVGGTTTSTYGYDLLGHITSTSSNGSLTRYTYDAMGNRSKINTAGGTSSYTYDSQTVRRLLSVTTPSGNFSFSYDANGNTSAKVTSTGTWTYSYDPFNRLTGVQWNGVSQASYGYNGKGQRTSKTAGGTSSAYLWDGANLAQENRGGTYFLYSYLGMQPIALTSTGTSQALETDLVGTVLGVVNASGVEIARYVSDDFGNPQAVVGSSANPFRFAGAFLDGESGLCQMRGRYYDPAFGRFLTQDINPGNPYSYCRNNPTSMSDPSGWWAEATQRCMTDGGPGLHPSIRCAVTMITDPAGALLYLCFNYIGYGSSVSIFGDKPIPSGSLVTKKTYEPHDPSGFDQYGMNTLRFAEASATRWFTTDRDNSFPMVLGEIIGATIFIGGMVLGVYLAGPLVEPILLSLGSKISADTMNTLAKFTRDVLVEKTAFNTLFNRQEPSIDNNEGFLAMTLWYLSHP